MRRGLRDAVSHASATRMLRASVATLLLVIGLAHAAAADPPEPGTSERPNAGRPGAAALGAGTIFMTLVDVGGGGTVFLAQGKILPTLAEPVGSCRLKLRGQIPKGTPLAVESVTSATSPYEDRGISSVTWHFAKDDPAESLFCDTVGSDGPSQGDVEVEVKGILKIEATAHLE
jgi:hypothetical protein